MGGWDSNTTEREPNNAFQTWNMKSEGAALKLAPVQLEEKKSLCCLVGILRSDSCGRLDVTDGAAATLEREEGKAGKDKRERGGEGRRWGGCKEGDGGGWPSGFRLM